MIVNSQVVGILADWDGIAGSEKQNYGQLSII